MPRIEFPNVPKALGVPDIKRGITNQSITNAALGIVQGALWQAFINQDNWGIFDVDNNKLADIKYTTPALSRLFGSSQSTLSVEFSKEMRSSDFPLELGSFASYNKVEMPATPTVVLCVTGTEDERKNFLTALDKATKSTTLYNVVTPEVVYEGYSIDRYNYSRRAESGATMLIVELSLKQVREVVPLYGTATIVSPANPESKPTANTGSVQPEKPKASLLKKGVDFVKGLF